MAKRAEDSVSADAELVPDEFLKTIPRITLLLHKPPTEDDLRKRGEIVERMDQFREKVGPIGVSVEDLIREDRASH
jgi:hypothetical protein